MKRILRAVRDEAERRADEHGRSSDRQQLRGGVAMYQREISSRASILAVNSDGDDADGDGHGETAHRRGAEDEQHHVRQERGRVTVDDRAVGAL